MDCSGWNTLKRGRTRFLEYVQDFTDMTTTTMKSTVLVPCIVQVELLTISLFFGQWVIETRHNVV